MQKGQSKLKSLYKNGKIGRAVRNAYCSQSRALDGLGEDRREEGPTISLSRFKVSHANFILKQRF